MCIAAARATAWPITTTSPRSHTELVKLCINALPTDQIWKEFSNRFDPWIKRYLIKIWKSLRPTNVTNFFDLLEEFVQEVYLLLLKEDKKALRMFRGTTNNAFLSYLLIICANVVREYLRSQSALKRAACFLPLDFLDDEQAVSHYLKLFYGSKLFEAETEMVLHLLKNQLWQRVDAVLRQCFSTRDQTIFLLTVIEGYSGSELSAKYDFQLKASSIDSIVRRTLTRLTNVLSITKPYSTNFQRKRGLH